MASISRSCYTVVQKFGIFTPLRYWQGGVKSKVLCFQLLVVKKYTLIPYTVYCTVYNILRTTEDGIENWILRLSKSVTVVLKVVKYSVRYRELKYELKKKQKIITWHCTFKLKAKSFSGRLCLFRIQTYSRCTVPTY